MMVSVLSVRFLGEDGPRSLRRLRRFEIAVLEIRRECRKAFRATEGPGKIETRISGGGRHPLVSHLSPVYLPHCCQFLSENRGYMLSFRSSQCPLCPTPHPRSHSFIFLSLHMIHMDLLVVPEIHHVLSYLKLVPTELVPTPHDSSLPELHIRLV